MLTVYFFSPFRLVHGSAPKGLKTPFVPELRLLGCIEVDRVFALPLQKDTDLIPVPLNSKLKLQRAKNMEQLENFIEYSRFLDKAQRLLQDARDRLQVIDLKLSEKDGKNSKDNMNNIKYGNNNNVIINYCNSNKDLPSSGSNTNGYVLRKSASCDSTSTAKYSYSSNGSIAEEYDEIDQIYDYVRGFAPLPKNLNKFEPIPEPASHQNSNNVNNSSNNNTSSSHNTNKSNDRKSSTSHHLDSNGNYTNLLKTSVSANNIENIKTASTPYHHHHHTHIHPMHEEKPIPPPIETIPTKKQPEKRQRPTLPKLYVKNNILGNNSIHHQKISSPLIMHSNGKESIEPQSPLFHIR